MCFVFLVKFIFNTRTNWYLNEYYYEAQYLKYRHLFIVRSACSPLNVVLFLIISFTCTQLAIFTLLSIDTNNCILFYRYFWRVRTQSFEITIGMFDFDYLFQNFIYGLIYKLNLQIQRNCVLSDVLIDPFCCYFTGLNTQSIRIIIIPITCKLV